MKFVTLIELFISFSAAAKPGDVSAIHADGQRAAENSAAKCSDPQHGGPQFLALGAIHKYHLANDHHYSLNDLVQAITASKPNIICGEVTPEGLGSKVRAASRRYPKRLGAGSGSFTQPLVSLHCNQVARLQKSYGQTSPTSSKNCRFETLVCALA